MQHLVVRKRGTLQGKIMKEEDWAWQCLCRVTQQVMADPLHSVTPFCVTAIAPPDFIIPKESRSLCVTWDWSEAALTQTHHLGLVWGCFCSDSFLQAKQSKRQDPLLIPLTAISVLQQQKANYSSPSGSLSLWAWLKEDLEDGTCPFRGNLDSVTKAVTWSDLSFCGSSVPFVWTGLTEWKMMIYSHFSRKIPSSHQSFLTL